MNRLEELRKELFKEGFYLIYKPNDPWNTSKYISIYDSSLAFTDWNEPTNIFKTNDLHRHIVYKKHLIAKRQFEINKEKELLSENIGNTETEPKERFKI